MAIFRSEHRRTGTRGLIRRGLDKISLDIDLRLATAILCSTKGWRIIREQ
jgi:hypothetical protein